MELISILAILFSTLYLVSSNEAGTEEGMIPADQESDQLSVGKDLITHSSVYFFENFNDKSSLIKSWIISKAKKKTDDGSTLQYDGDWVLEKPFKDNLPNDLGLTFLEKAKHRAISAKLFRDFTFTNRPFVIQYEVLHQDGQECGGAYLKLISKERSISDLNEFNDKSPYTIMFGPDKCGISNKLHFIFRHKNPLNGSFEEKHCKQAKSRIDETFTDAKPHLFKLVLNPDNTFSIAVDHKVINEGSLLKDFEPPVNPPREIDDPNDKKPEDWDDRAKIPDPNAKKPDDWDDNAPPEIPDVKAEKPSDWLEDEPVNISDPSAEKPDDWDEEMDGEWEAPLVPNPACEEAPGCGPWSPPLISNPEYKGKWAPPLIDNPNFKGVWLPRKIPNPDFFEDKHPYKMMTIDAVGFELWSVSSKILFDNIIITDDENVANQLASITFDKKLINIEKSADSLWSRIMVAINHKPGWWSLYFLYCLCPISIYAWYLWRRVKEDTMLNQFVAFTNRYPWLWALYVVGLLIPVTLIVVCCFWSNKESDASKKKNDDIGLDDSGDVQSGDGSTSYSSISSAKGKGKGKKGKDDDEHSHTSEPESGLKSNSRESSHSNLLEEEDDASHDENEAGEKPKKNQSDGSNLVAKSDSENEEKDYESEEDESPIDPPEPKSVLKKRNKFSYF